MQPLIPSTTPLTASSRFYKLCAQILVPSFRRHQSSARRTRSKLNIKPDPAFLPSKTEQHDHIIHNPPPSMPNVLHTPNVFLPKTDPRKIPSPPPSSQAPSLFKSTEKRYHVTEAQADEMRTLRAQDPTTWSINKLAKKYDCSHLFVQFVVGKLAPEAKKMQQDVTAAVKSNWSKSKRIAREDREIRRELWQRDA
ncbi:uncharacterized protein A1O9_00074 [Exophiala aquamarina CBS 119918]|uniref:Uncharacterized protein n=1 Tax=Exophiala aquamarina CBS 119918 TaxID=1182545 RepID=A0A072PQS1_9EURO|nr:uncharacterized protein A1O9_00074 [Exophiala aquamarina CBS 119918]KEF62102.1 hypothetical protein A1O9_00074 [Exophiala aquamarina CBS 119918]